MTTEKLISLLKKPMLFGSVTTAKSTCGNKNCQCHTDKSKLHGPYYRWTGYSEGKYRCVTLSQEEALETKKWTDNYKLIQIEMKKLKINNLKKAPWINMRKKD